MAAYTAYDPKKDKNYQNAATNKNNAVAAKPVYKNSYAGTIDDQYNNIVNREKFSYNVNEDALFRQYKDNYVKQGQMAMRDTMGQAAALTGGYASSYGQSVGQQQYNAYLQRLNDVVPELYQMAYQQYQDEGQNMMNQYNMTRDLADDEYKKYQDENANYWNNVNYWANEEDNAYNRGQAQSDKAYKVQQDKQDNLVTLITTTGYVPTDAELAEAGMTRAQANSYKSYYDKNNPVQENSGGTAGYIPPNGPPNGPSNEPTTEEIVVGMVKNGTSNPKQTKSDVSNYIDNSYKAGKITAQERDDLKNKYVKPAKGYTY